MAHAPQLLSDSSNLSPGCPNPKLCQFSSHPSRSLEAPEPRSAWAAQAGGPEHRGAGRELLSEPRPDVPINVEKWKSH